MACDVSYLQSTLRATGDGLDDDFIEEEWQFVADAADEEEAEEDDAPVRVNWYVDEDDEEDAADEDEDWDDDDAELEDDYDANDDDEYVDNDPAYRENFEDDNYFNE